MADLFTRTRVKREQDAGLTDKPAPVVAPAPAAPPVDFLKSFTEQEKAAQRAKLAAILAAQQK